MSAFLDTFFPHVSGVSYEELNGTRPCAEFGGEWHFICVSGGRGSMELDGVAYPLSAGHVVQLPAGRKSALRRYKETGTAVEEVVFPAQEPPELGPHDRTLPIPLMRGGVPVPDLPTLEDSRQHLRRALELLRADEVVA